MRLSLAQLTDQLAECGLMSPEDIQAVVEALPAEHGSQDGEHLVRELVRQRKLTAFQAQQVYQGKGRHLVLGNYVVLDKLGQGGMGMVLKAEHRRMQRLVALKVLSPAVTKSPEALRRFQREIRAAATLNHPNIVTAYDADEAQGTHFLVMEYVEGTNLAALVRDKGPLPVDQALSCVLQAARGLEYAHSRGVVHRDIKPSNLLLDRGGTVKILDMGLARFESAGAEQSELTAMGQMMGTVDFMAPEQAKDTHHADARADIYSLGVTLWYLVTGRALFAGETAVVRLLAHQQEPVPSLGEACAGASPALEAVFARMVAKTPQERYQSMTEVIADLERARTGDAAPPTGGSASGTADRLSEFLRGLSQPTVAGSRISSAPAVAAKRATASAFAETVTQAGPVLDTDPKAELSFHAPVVSVRSGQRSAGRGWLERLPMGRKWRAAVLVGCGLGVVALGALGVALVWKTDKEPARTKVNHAQVDRRGSANANVATAAGWHGWPADAPPPAIAPFNADQAKAHQEAWADYLKLPVEYENSVGMKFVLIPPGEFLMGSAPAEIEAALVAAGGADEYWKERIRSEAPQHKVILTSPVYLAVHEVTQAQYEQVMGQNPSHFAATGPGKDAVVGLDTATHPVELVSWNEAAEFCSKLSEKEQLKPFKFELRAGDAVTIEGTGYRLPTEAEWEFACRAGTKTKNWIGDQEEQLFSVAWFGSNSGGRTHAVGELMANPLGLYDIYGNVWEWVQDGWEANYYTQFQEKPALDPSGPSSAGSQRVVRGGDWRDGASSCRASGRDACDPTHREDGFGFRVALAVDAVRAAIAEGTTKPASATAGWQGWPADAPQPAIVPFKADQARAYQESWAAHLGVPVEYENTIGMKFVLIPPGEFLMGSTPEEIEAALVAAGQDTYWKEHIPSEAPQHKVILTSPIYLGIHEVTQAEYEKVMGQNPSHFAPMGAGNEAVVGLDTSTHPVEVVSWNDAAEFCAKLSEKEKLKPLYLRAGETVAPLRGNGYRMPTEAEWEFACGAGTTTRFWTGDEDQDLLPAGWFNVNSGSRTHAVGELKASPFGLYDIHGNVFEWVQDWWEPNYFGLFVKGPAVDPNGPSSAGSQRVCRGGCSDHPASSCRASGRNATDPTYRGGHIGFRVALAVEGVRLSVKAAGDGRRVSPEASLSGWHGWPADAPPPAIAPFDRDQARAHQESWAAYLKLPVEYQNTIGMKFVLIPPGEFLMGSTPEEIEAALVAGGTDEWWKECIRTEAPQHKVILTSPVYLGVHEVTQAKYEKVMGQNPSYFAATGPGKDVVVGLDTATHPVEQVSWNDAAEFCAKLSEKEKLKPFYFRSGEMVAPLRGNGYRMPTEAEWEFACHAGTTTRFWSGDEDEDLLQTGWFGSNSGGRTHAVGELKANPFGLYDIHGNVWEWAQDWWEPNYYVQFQEKPALDPSGPSSAGSLRIKRGGSWECRASHCRASTRFPDFPAPGYSHFGFRVALAVDAVRQAVMASGEDQPDG